jgi:hypothetical protein
MKQLRTLFLLALMPVLALAQANPAQAFVNGVYTMVVSVAATCIAIALVWGALRAITNPMIGVSAIGLAIGMGYIAIHPMSFVNWIQTL